ASFHRQLEAGDGFGRVPVRRRPIRSRSAGVLLRPLPLYDVPAKPRGGLRHLVRCSEEPIPPPRGSLAHPVSIFGEGIAFVLLAVRELALLRDRPRCRRHRHHAREYEWSDRRRTSGPYVLRYARRLGEHRRRASEDGLPLETRPLSRRSDGGCEPDRLRRE